MLVGLDAQGGLEGQHLRALGDGPLHLFRLGGHVLLAAAVDAGHLVRPKADGGAGHVHGNVAAADDHHVLSGEVRHLVVTDVAQQLHGGDDAQAVLPLNAGLLVRVGADGEIQAVVLLLQLVKGHVHTHIHAGMYLDTQREDGGDLRVQLLPGQTVAGDAVAHHAPQLALLFVHGDPVAHKGQVVCGGETAGAAAHNGHGLAGGGGGLRLGHIPGVVHGVTLEPPDIQSVVHHVPAAAGLAGVLADVGAGGGEGIVLADQAHRVAAAALADEGDVAGNIHPGGAQRHAGHGVFEAPQAPVVEDVLLVVVPEAPQAHENQIGRVDADGAVRGVHNHLGGALNAVENLHAGLAVQHLADHVGQLGQPHPARHALAAGLGTAEVQKIQRHVHRAQTRGAGGDPPLHVPVQLLHHGLGLAGGLDFQSAHTVTSFRKVCLVS